MEQGKDCVVLDWGVNLMSNQLGILNKIFHFKILLWSGLPIGQDLVLRLTFTHLPPIRRQSVYFELTSYEICAVLHFRSSEKVLYIFMQLVCVKLATWKPLGAYFKGKCLLFLCAGVRWSTWHGMGKWPCDLVASAWWPIDHLITSLSSLLEIACSSCILSNVARPDLHGLLLRLQAPSKQQDILSTKPWGGLAN